MLCRFSSRFVRLSFPPRSLSIALFLCASTSWAQQRPLETQEPAILPPGLRILLSENERGTSLRSMLRSTTWQQAVFCIGPEGGWTEAEHQELVGLGFQPASLGSQILRTETAALVVAAILKYEQES